MILCHTVSVDVNSFGRPGSLSTIFSMCIYCNKQLNAIKDMSEIVFPMCRQMKSSI